MTYEELLKDLELLVRMDLDSIRKGAEIRLVELDHENERLLLETKAGRLRSRPLSEIQKIWAQLQMKPAVHVDSVLSGSGSSRNQPETILANLPYIEWLIINKKKHLCFVGKKTHAYGTLKKTDPVQAQEVLDKLRKYQESSNNSLTIVVTNNVLKTSSVLEQVTGLVFSPQEQGLYKLASQDLVVFIATTKLVPSEIRPGTYVVIKSNNIPDNAIFFELAGKRFFAVCEEDLHFIVAAN